MLLLSFAVAFGVMQPASAVVAVQPAPSQSANVLRLPGDQVRWTHDLTADQSKRLRSLVYTYRNSNSTIVTGIAGMVCGIIGFKIGGVGAIITGGTCALIVTVYWGDFKRVVLSLDTKKGDRLRIQERCSFGITFIPGSCRLYFQNIGPVVK